MSKAIQVVLYCVGGAVAGAIGFTSLIIALMTLSRRMREDGQSMMVVFLTVPIGAVVGLLLGGYMAASRLVEK